MYTINKMKGNEMDYCLLNVKLNSLTYLILSKTKLTFMRIAHNGILLVKSLPVYSFNCIKWRCLGVQPY